MPTTTRPTIERRVFPLKLRESVKGSNGRQRWATAVTYGTVDTYGTLWLPGVFDEALNERLPTILYGHDWYSIDHVLGKGIDHREADYGVDVLIEFADPVKVPKSALAMELVRDKIIKDVSVGFERFEWRDGKDIEPDEALLGAREVMVKAGMDELSLVVRGAVPGAGLRTRSRRGAVDLDAVMEIAKRKIAGELTDAEAQAAVDLLAQDETAGGDAPKADETPADETPPDHTEVDAELDQVLADRTGW